MFNPAHAQKPGEQMFVSTSVRGIRRSTGFATPSPPCFSFPVPASYLGKQSNASSSYYARRPFSGRKLPGREKGETILAGCVRLRVARGACRKVGNNF